MERIRVLVVDDSAFARKVVREVLSSDPRLQVVGTARDGLDALEKIGELRPDVLTLDLMMPHLDGLGVLASLGRRPSPRVVVVSISAGESELVLDALALGAVDVVTKPTALATDRLYELGGELVAKVLTAARARPPPPLAERRPVPPPASCRRPPEPPGLLEPAPTEVVVIGTSTGGPRALTEVLRGLPGDLRAAIAMALHIPADYTLALAARIDAHSSLRVVEAGEGMPLVAGRAVLARGGRHLVLARENGALVTRLPVKPHGAYVPSVDELFASAARTCGAAVLGVVLTGMGDDGLEGARAIVAAGGRVLTEAEESCVIYGMPRVVDEAGLSSARVPLERIAEVIASATTPAPRSDPVARGPPVV